MIRLRDVKIKVNDKEYNCKLNGNVKIKRVENIDGRYVKEVENDYVLIPECFDVKDGKIEFSIILLQGEKRLNGEVKNNKIYFKEYKKY